MLSSKLSVVDSAWLPVSGTGVGRSGVSRGWDIDGIYPPMRRRLFLGQKYGNGGRQYDHGTHARGNECQHFNRQRRRVAIRVTYRHNRYQDDHGVHNTKDWRQSQHKYRIWHNPVTTRHSIRTSTLATR